MPSQPPLRYIKGSLSHLLDDVASVREMSEVKDVVKVDLDAETTVVLGAKDGFWERITEEAQRRQDVLLGASASMRNAPVKIAAKWEAQRDAEPWEEPPVVTFLLVVDADGKTQVVERCELFLWNTPIARQ